MNLTVNELCISVFRAAKFAILFDGISYNNIIQQLRLIYCCIKIR